MVRGIGTDIVQNSRFDQPSPRLLEKVFTAYERAEGEKRVNRSEYYASRFAAKEAVSKALGTGFCGITPQEIEIHEDEKGCPYVSLPERFRVRLLLSITHEKEYSVAMAVAEDE